MDKEIAKRILKVYGNPSFKVGNTNITFSRQDLNAVEEIEKLTDEELISQWKSYVFINEIYGQVSLGEMQRIDLLELELDERKIDDKPLKEWYDKIKSEFEENEDLNEVEK